MPCVGNSTFYCRKTLCPTFSWCFWGGNNPLSSREDIRSTVFQSCVFTAMKANVFIVENVCVSAQWMWRSIRNPANEREERSAYSVMNVRRSVRPKHCIKKWSWRYSCNGKVEFFTYTWKIKDIIWNVDYDILQTRYSAKCNRKEYAQCQRKRNLQYTSEV